MSRQGGDDKGRKDRGTGGIVRYVSSNMSKTSGNSKVLIELYCTKILYKLYCSHHLRERWPCHVGGLDRQIVIL